MPALRIPVFAIMAPGDLDGPRPILYFTERSVAEMVRREMNGGRSSGEYGLKQATVWSGTPTQTSVYGMKGWLDRDSGEFLANHPRPRLEHTRLWPWELEHWSARSHAGPVPIGIYISVDGPDRAAVERDFARLVDQERAKIATVAP